MLVHPDFTAELLPWLPTASRTSVLRMNSRKDIVGTTLFESAMHGYIFISGAPQPILLERNTQAYCVSEDSAFIAGSVFADPLQPGKPAVWRFDPETTSYRMRVLDFKDVFPPVNNFFSINKFGDALLASYDRQGNMAVWFMNRDREDVVSLNSLLPPDAAMRDSIDCFQLQTVDDKRQIAGCGVSMKDSNRGHAWVLQLSPSL